MRINVTVVNELKLARRRLEGLCDLDDDGECAVDAEHKEGVRLYVQTWVTPLLQSALDRIEGRKESRVEGRRGRRT